MSKHFKYISLPVIVLAIMAIACSRPAPDTRAQEAAQLYHELKQVYAQYADSMEQGTDSADWSRSASGLEEALRKVYDNHSADLDEYLSQAQNDTLWQLASRYIKFRGSHRLPQDVQVDSLRHDSLP